MSLERGQLIVIFSRKVSLTAGGPDNFFPETIDPIDKDNNNGMDIDVEDTSIVNSDQTKEYF